ncbi:MAG: C40 family peptidase [candidate division Zixibacteria bacterium]|nr:C40 family peptidase [candidate division Zixibacteria bacterium]
MLLKPNLSKFSGYARVSTGLTDLLKKPDGDSERLTQALWGSRVKLIGNDNKGFIRCELKDGYKGYIRAYHLNDEIKKYHPDIIITLPFVAVRIHPKANSDIVIGLHFNTELEAVSKNKGWTQVRTSSDDSGWIQNDSYKRQRSKSKSISIDAIIKTAKSFIGTPYLWGGITPSGWDCSGFLQAILKHHGIRFPRDTIDQIRKGRLIKYGNHRNGELIFFSRHVGMFVGDDTIIHCSLQRGAVQIDKIGADAGEFGQALYEDIKAVRRII